MYGAIVLAVIVGGLFFMVFAVFAAVWYMGRGKSKQEDNTEHEPMQVFKVERRGDGYCLIWPKEMLCLPSSGWQGIIEYIEREIRNLQAIRKHIEYLSTYNKEAYTPDTKKSCKTKKPHESVFRDQMKSAGLEIIKSTCAEKQVKSAGLEIIKSKCTEKQERVGVNIDVKSIEQEFIKERGRSPNIKELAHEIARKYRLPIVQVWPILKQTGYC